MKHAKELDMNPFAWGAAGFASYYVPQLVVGALFGVYMLMENIELDSSTETGINILGIIPGAMVAYWVYHKMPHWATAKKQSQNDDLLDDNDFLGRT